MTGSRWIAVTAAMVASACTFGPERLTRIDVDDDVIVAVIDEFGAPISDAVFTEVGGSVHETDDDGLIDLELSEPVAGVVSAPGTLAEPFAVAPRDDDLTVSLWNRDGPNGERVALHFGGDTMLGRRYQEPTRTDTAVALDAKAARSVVSDLGPLSSAADATIVNLESVVGTLPVEDAHPGKIFLVQSPPFVTNLLDELGADLVTLGNNHAYDWQDPGIVSTLEVLDAVGLPYVGAGLDEESAAAGQLIAASRRGIGVISMTTLSGDAFNSNLPVRGQLRSELTDPSTDWQYELRTFGFGEPGLPGYIAEAERVPREAWDEFSELEPTLAPEQIEALWNALTTPGAYPELQDWVARRGHGGAAAYDREKVAGEIDRLRSLGADTVIVQFHAGFEMNPAPSTSLRSNSRAAIDAGADMVISHHPHVLQGAEWYRGRLIAYSLGNFVFDQNLLATFPSAILRVVVDDGGLIDARFVPLTVDRYRPVPVAGEVAERIVRLLSNRSTRQAVGGRVMPPEITTILLDEASDGVDTAAVTLDRNTGRIERGSSPFQTEVTVSSGQIATLPPCFEVLINDLPQSVEYGVDLFGWGSFDDGTGDRDRTSVMHWRVPTQIDDWALVQGATDDPFDDAIELKSDANRTVFSRNISLVTVGEHEIWLPGRPLPADTVPTYSVSLDAKRERGETPTLRVAAYRVADEDLTREPDTKILREITVELDVPDDGEWHSLDVELPETLFDPRGELPVDGLFAYVQTPPAFRGSLTFDNLRIYQWRTAPDHDFPLWEPVDALRSESQRTVELNVAGCGTG